MTRDETVAARALSIMASDRRWTLDEVVGSLVEDSRHVAAPRRIAFSALARACMRPRLTSSQARAEAEAAMRSRGWR